MPRARNLKHDFFLDDELAEHEPVERLFFASLWCLADFRGNIEWRPKRLKTQTLPYDDVNLESIAINLDKSGFIRFYSDGEKVYLNIRNFTTHQNPHKNERDKGSTIPEYSEKLRQVIDLHTLTINPDKSRINPDANGTNPADSCNLIPDSCNPIPEVVGQPASPPIDLRERFAMSVDWVPTFDEMTLKALANAKVTNEIIETELPKYIASVIDDKQRKQTQHDWNKSFKTTLMKIGLGNANEKRSRNSKQGFDAASAIANAPGAADETIPI